MDRVQEWNELAAQLCVDSIRCSTAAGSGHPTSSMSASHLVAVLFSDHLRFDVDDPKNTGNDRFILSKGHASPLLFSALRAVGAITDDELLSFRKFGSPIQGHPAPVATSTQGISGTGSTWPRALLVRGFPSDWGWPWPFAWTTSPGECGCCAATPSSSRGRCGRR